MPIANTVDFTAAAFIPASGTRVFVAAAGFEVLEAMGTGSGFGKAGADLRWEGAGGEGAEEGEAG